MINSNFGPISHCLRDMASFPLKYAQFSYPCIQCRIWKCSSWTASPKFFVRKVSSKVC